MATVATLPVERTHRVWLEEQAAKIAYRLAGASRNKVRTNIIVGLRCRGLPLDEARIEADRALDYLDARVAQLRQVRSLSPFTPIAAGGGR